MAKPKPRAAREEVEEATVEGALDPGAMRAVARAAAPLALIAFIACATASLVVVLFARDPDAAPAWLFGAVFSLAVWAVARDQRAAVERS